ncbi:hypothetical protein [Hyphomicrobium sp. DMF-1]|jgi:hypothetical protein|uniref:hypothetical protein n=1 Tax=Hyphomicrobium sp. DMF-1 TaxID=3019544 RepID=UPI0022EC0047|nr:hypothetical protein [Hyphomicrobium sp. DMF-1]WBT39640.1 hypothetical protein PE058_07095 [Hyphomicrobium sp. DMF-1]
MMMTVVMAYSETIPVASMVAVAPMSVVMMSPQVSMPNLYDLRFAGLGALPQCFPDCASGNVGRSRTEESKKSCTQEAGD